MKEVKSVDLVLENCEVIRIPKECIGHLNVSNISRNISRFALNSLTDSQCCDELFIEISLESNKSSSFVSTWSGNDELPFSRITRRSDITGIDISYEDESNELIFVKWGGDSDYENPFQTVEVNKAHGDFYLAISDKKRAKEYFQDYLKEEHETIWNSLSDM